MSTTEQTGAVEPHPDSLQAELAEQLGQDAADAFAGGASPCSGCTDPDPYTPTVPSWVSDALVKLNDEQPELGLVLSYLTMQADKMGQLVDQLAEVAPQMSSFARIGETIEQQGIGALLGDGGFRSLFGKG